MTTVPTFYTLGDLAIFTGLPAHTLRYRMQRDKVVPSAALYNGGVLYSEETALNLRLDALLELQLKSTVLGQHIPQLDDKIAQLRVLTKRTTSRSRERV